MVLICLFVCMFVCLFFLDREIIYLTLKCVRVVRIFYCIHTCVSVPVLQPASQVAGEKHFPEPFRRLPLLVEGM